MSPLAILRYGEGGVDLGLAGLSNVEIVLRRGTPIPPSRQIAAHLRAQIASGELPPGSVLPSILRLSQEYGTTTNTVRKALTILKNEGLIESVSGYGTFVKEG
jgi:GntR family transcriptional regulator